MQNNYIPAKQADTHEHIQIEVLPNNKSPEMVKSPEEFPLVAKGHSPTSPPVVQSPYDNKSVTLTFKDLSYSVLVKNDQKLGKSDPKRKTFISVFF